MNEKYIAICIENCNPPHEGMRYLQCTALQGRKPGLAVAPDGEVTWQDASRGELFQLWVSMDHQLIAYRPEKAPGGTRVHRAGREVELPEGKPVVLLSGDYLLFGSHCYRVHIHGDAQAPMAPRFLGEDAPASTSAWARIAVTGALVLGATMGACNQPSSCDSGKPPVEIRDKPPAPPRPMDPPSLEPIDTQNGMPAEMPPEMKEEAGSPPPPEMKEDAKPVMPPAPIEVRPGPPAVPPPPIPSPVKPPAPPTR